MKEHRARSAPEPLGPFVARELDRLGGTGTVPAGLSRILDAWGPAVGPAVASNSWPARIRRDGTLVVHTSSSAWAFELSQLEATVRSTLGEVAPPRIQFVVGPLPEPPGAVPEASQSLPRAGAKEAQQGADIARVIEDAELRELVSRAAAAALARAVSDAGSAGGSDTL
jgi:hypothetical protein